MKHSGQFLRHKKNVPSFQIFAHWCDTKCLMVDKHALARNLFRPFIQRNHCHHRRLRISSIFDTREQGSPLVKFNSATSRTWTRCLTTLACGHFVRGLCHAIFLSSTGEQFSPNRCRNRTAAWKSIVCWSFRSFATSFAHGPQSSGSLPYNKGNTSLQVLETLQSTTIQYEARDTLNLKDRVVRTKTVNFVHITSVGFATQGDWCCFVENLIARYTWWWLSDLFSLSPPLVPRIPSRCTVHIQTNAKPSLWVCVQYGGLF